MTPTIKIHTPNLTRELEAYVKQSSRTAAEVINGRAFFSMVNAARITKRADRSQIMKLGVSIKSERTYVDKRTGKERVRRLYNVDDIAVSNYLIFQKARFGRSPREIYREHGSREALRKIAKRWITRKLSAIGFLASTFKPLIDKFRRHGSGAIPGDLKRYRAVKSTSKPASPSDPNPQVTLSAIANDYPSDDIGLKAQGLAAKAMSIGINLEIHNMRRIMNGQMARDFSKLNSR
jgi:hypothetical protein